MEFDNSMIGFKYLTRNHWCGTIKHNTKTCEIDCVMTLCKPNAIYRYFNIVIESKLERNILRLRLRIILTNIDRMWSVNVEYVRLMQLICMKFLRRNYNILIRIGGGVKVRIDTVRCLKVKMKFQALLLYPIQSVYSSIVETGNTLATETNYFSDNCLTSSFFSFFFFYLVGFLFICCVLLQCLLPI